MLAPQVLRTADAYWAGHLGCEPARLQSPRPVLLPHGAELDDYAGAFLFRRHGAAPVLSLPPARLAQFGAPLAAAASDGLEADGRWAAILGGLLARTIGPAWIGYASTETLAAAPPGAAVRPLGPADAPHLQRLRDAASPEDWENVASLPSAGWMAGAFSEGELSAVAGYEVWAGTIAHIAVLTHPAHRGRGLARVMAHAAARRALQQGLVPQYRVLESNLPSRRVADGLGFAHYATSLALRFSAPAPA